MLARLECSTAFRSLGEMSIMYACNWKEIGAGLKQAGRLRVVDAICADEWLRLASSSGEPVSAQGEALQAPVDTIRVSFQAVPMIPAMKRVVLEFAQDPDWRVVRPPADRPRRCGRSRPARNAARHAVRHARQYSVLINCQAGIDQARVRARSHAVPPHRASALIHFQSKALGTVVMRIAAMQWSRRCGRARRASMAFSNDESMLSP